MGRAAQRRYGVSRLHFPLPLSAVLDSKKRYREGLNIYFFTNEQTMNKDISDPIGHIVDLEEDPLRNDLRFRSNDLH